MSVVRKVLITGASGFIGTNLVPRLLEKGHRVCTLGRSPDLPLALRPYAGEHLEHRLGDITDLESLRSAVAGMDVVYHLAGFISYTAADLDRQWSVNVNGTRNVMQAALDASVSRVIHTGSIAGMGIPEPGVIGTEEMIYNLSGLGLNYCDSKHAGEQEVLSFAKQGLPVVILNPGIIFGEGDTHPHHRTIFAAISRGWLVGCPKGGVTFCDIKDVIEAHLNAMTMGRIGERYVIGSCNLTYRQAACVVSEITGLPPPRFEIPGCLLESLGAVCEALFPLVGRRPPLTRQVAWLSQRNIFFSFDKARRELGLKQTTFQDTIRRTAAYYLGGAQSGNRRR